jgi:ElaB/YqjD/DUF883 family membrane-anchored ribosome-binding protein
MAKDKMEEQQDGSRSGDGRATLTADGEEAFEQAGEALHGLRAAIDQTAKTLRELSRAGEEWAKQAEGRALEIGKGLRGQGERAVGGVARQVEQNPLTSVAIAFALGLLCAAAARRR